MHEWLGLTWGGPPPGLLLPMLACWPAGLPFEKGTSAQQRLEKGEDLGDLKLLGRDRPSPDVCVCVCVCACARVQRACCCFVVGVDLQSSSSRHCCYMANPSRQGFQRLVETDGDAEESATTLQNAGPPRFAAPVGAIAGGVILLALAFAGLWVYEYPPAGPGWWPEHVEETCINARAIEARRLGAKRDDDDDDDDDDDPNNYHGDGDGDGDGNEDYDEHDKKEDKARGGAAKVPLRGLLKAVVADSTIFHFPLFGSYFMPYYGSVDLANEKRSFIEVAVLFFHGAARNAKDYFCTMKTLVEQYTAENQTAIEKYAILAPKYHYKIDFGKNSSHIDFDLWWNGSKPFGDWRSGAAADEDSSPKYNSFEVLDEILLQLSDPFKFPNLRRIVLAGHSAGGVVVQRYALVSHLRPPDLATDETLKEMKSVRHGIEVRYVIANPSTFGYLDNNRWNYDWDPINSEWTEMEYKEYKPELGRRNWDADSGPSRRRHTGLRAEYRPWGPLSPALEPRSEQHPFICKTFKFGDWPFGMNWTEQEFGNLVPYVLQHPHLHRATEFYSNRHVVYLTGQNDTCTDDMLGKDTFGNAICSASCWTRGKKKQCARTLMDVRCPAMLEGPNRHQRAHNYMKHLEHFFGKKVHTLLQVDGVGHDAMGMYKSTVGMDALFADDIPSQ